MPKKRHKLTVAGKVRRMYRLRKNAGQTTRGIVMDNRLTSKKTVPTVRLFARLPHKKRRRYDVPGLDTCGGLCMGKIQRKSRKAVVGRRVLRKVFARRTKP